MTPAPSSSSESLSDASVECQCALPVCYYYALENYSAFTYIMGNNSNLSKFRNGGGHSRPLGCSLRTAFLRGISCSGALRVIYAFST